MEVNNNANLMLNIGTTMLKKTLDHNEEAMATLLKGATQAAPTQASPAPTRALDIYA